MLGVLWSKKTFYFLIWSKANKFIFLISDFDLNNILNNKGVSYLQSTLKYKDPEYYKKVDINIIDSGTGKVFLKSGEKFNILIAKELDKNSVKSLLIPDEHIIGNYLANDIYDAYKIVDKSNLDGLILENFLVVKKGIKI